MAYNISGTQLTGGDTPVEPGNPRTFPDLYNDLIGSIQTAFNEVETDISNVATSISEKETDITTLQNDLESLESTVSSMQTALSDLESDYEDFKTATNDRLDALESE